MKVRLSTDFLTALMFLGFGLFLLLYGAQYPMGSASRMGAGYFPRLISFGLLVVGAILLVQALKGEGERLEGLNLRPLFFVLAGTLGFGLLIQRAGLVIAGTVLVILVRLASDDFRMLEVLALAAVLVAATATLFTYILGLPIPVWPRWWH